MCIRDSPKANDVLIVGETYDITWTAKNLEEGSIEIRDASELLATLSRDETSFEWIATNANTIKVLNVDDDGNEVVSDSVDFDIDAVSYTHLDVYKRQIFNTAWLNLTGSPYSLIFFNALNSTSILFFLI